jgi:hypothetical protein
MSRHVIFDENSFPDKDQSVVSLPSKIAARDEPPLQVPVSILFPLSHALFDSALNNFCPHF